MIMMITMRMIMMMMMKMTKMAITRSIFKLGPPDFVWEYTQIMPMDDDDDYNNDDDGNDVDENYHDHHLPYKIWRYQLKN